MRMSLKLLISAIGIFALVFGIIFICQSGSAKQQVADDITPVTLDDLNATYDSVSMQQQTIMATEEPNIQAGTAAPSATYAYLTAQKVGLGLAKSNVGLANLVMNMGIVDIVIGLGLLASSILIPSKTKA